MMMVVTVLVFPTFGLGPILIWLACLVAGSHRGGDPQRHILCSPRPQRGSSLSP